MTREGRSSIHEWDSHLIPNFLGLVLAPCEASLSLSSLGATASPGVLVKNALPTSLIAKVCLSTLLSLTYFFPLAAVTSCHALSGPEHQEPVLSQFCEPEVGSQGASRPALPRISRGNPPLLPTASSDSRIPWLVTASLQPLPASSHDVLFSSRVCSSSDN